MKKLCLCLILITSILFFSCDLLTTLEKLNDFTNYAESLVELKVTAFSEDSVILQWSTEEVNARYNIYVKDKDSNVKCVESNYGKTNYFVASDNKSSYAIGIIINGIEYKTKYIYPAMEDSYNSKAGFPVTAKISEENLLGVEFFYPDNVDYFNLNIVKENKPNTIYPTTKYSAPEMGSYLFPLVYEKNSHNNYFIIIFTIDEKEYKSAPYYFDYDDELKVRDQGKKGSITFYPDL